MLVDHSTAHARMLIDGEVGFAGVALMHVSVKSCCVDICVRYHAVRMYAHTCVCFTYISCATDPAC